jgi:hypothetical protein
MSEHSREGKELLGSHSLRYNPSENTGVSRSDRDTEKERDTERERAMR